MTFTCHDSQIVAVQWKLDSYIEQGAHLTFISTYPIGFEAVAHMGMISANLSEVTNKNGSVADITTTLTIITHGLLNRTNISCLTAKEDNSIFKSSSAFFFAGMCIIITYYCSFTLAVVFQTHHTGIIH